MRVLATLRVADRILAVAASYEKSPALEHGAGMANLRTQYGGVTAVTANAWLYRPDLLEVLNRAVTESAPTQFISVAG
jgi:hypothetical protein